MGVLSSRFDDEEKCCVLIYNRKLKLKDVTEMRKFSLFLLYNSAHFVNIPENVIYLDTIQEQT